jgi:hypothetical protein
MSKEKLIKAIDDVLAVLKKTDPKTKLPGVLLDKANVEPTMPASGDQGDKPKKSPAQPAMPKPAAVSIKRPMPNKMMPVKTSKLAHSEDMNKTFAAKPDSMKAVTDTQMSKSQHLAKWMKTAVSKCMAKSEEEKRRMTDPAAAKSKLEGAHKELLAETKDQVATKKQLTKAYTASEKPLAQPMKKDDQPHPAGSPEERSHAVAEGKESLPYALADVKGHDAKTKFFNHLRTLKDKSQHRSPENVAKMGGMDTTPMEKANEKGVHNRSMIPARSTPKMESKNSSAMGDEVRSHQTTKGIGSTKALGNAKTEATSVLSQLKNMPKPNLPKSEKE